ncbi:unnamed protein product [Rotaria magnacalcarata]|uniref:Transposase n=6 Tax=Rotaria magnacalcarata TaxID=392030 RepID=A0A814WYT5_9BILA|nr:unnamed protein product [Rotaria magnacalcarata]
MKSKDMQKVVKTKFENSDGPTKIYRDLAGVVSLQTIKSWIKKVRNTGSIELSSPPGRPRTTRTKANILKAKQRLDQKRVSTRRSAAEMNISKSSIHRILRKDLGCFPDKKIKQPKLTMFEKRTVKFSNWVLNNYTKSDITRWLFSDEKYFDLNGIYNNQNDRIWAISRKEADKRGAIYETTKFPVKVMVWLGVCSEGLSVPVIFEDESMDAQRYIDEVLPIALECGNEMLGEHRTYQQDGARPRIHYLSQKWCVGHFSSFISKDRWPPNSSDLCPFDYSLWNELAKLMNWKKITTKELLIQEIKHSVKKIEKEKILNSVNDFTKRLRIIKETGGEYVR